MKDWSYYKPDSSLYPDKHAYATQLHKEIAEARMTANEREEAKANVGLRVQEWYNEAILPYREQKSRLINEFWADCRADLGYDEFLNERGVAKLEGWAWEHGHSGGFSEVYGELCNAIELFDITFFKAHKV